MLERIPEEHGAAFVQALKRYREGLQSSEFDYGVVNNLKGILSLSSSDASLLDDITMQLFQGTYGICTSCGDPISERRLLCLPLAAKFCRDCQEAKEDNAPTTTSKSKQQRYQDPTPDRSRRAARHRRALQSFPDLSF